MFLVTGKKDNITSIFKMVKKDDPRNYQHVSLTFIGRNHGEILLEVMLKHVEDSEVMWEN